MPNDYTAFWGESDYYTSPGQVTDSIVIAVEKRLGYKLPNSYIELMKTKNGGTPVNTCYPTKAATTWAKDHIAITGIRGIGGLWGIDSNELGSKFMIEEWGYPDIGILVCTCPSGGHDAVMLDYSECGKNGEPRVIHVDIDTFDQAEIIVLAENFETFIKGLVNEKEFAPSEEELSEYQILSVWIDPDFLKQQKKGEKSD